MKLSRDSLFEVSVLLFLGHCCMSLATQPAAASCDPSAADYSNRKGRTIYVSKQGDNSDGTSWQKAFQTIQAALLAVPDDQGGHQIFVRPDTYVEANLYALHKGAPGAYNLIVGDFDGKLGSRASGRVVVDCSASNAPASGFKSVAGWRNFSGPPGSASNMNYDRWIFRRICATGGETAFGIYAAGAEGKKPASLLVEDCIGIGRMAGACLDGGVGRPDEPIQFRRCHFMSLDRWQDAGGVFLRAQNASMPDRPDLVLEDCTLVSPDNALRAASAGDSPLCARVKLKKCRLIVLNFAQTQFGPDQASSGIIHCNAKDGRQLHVDLEDCRLMGYKLFGARQGNVSYTTTGSNQVYVQFQQTVPRAFDRIGLWPTNWITRIGVPNNLPSPSGRGAGGEGRVARARRIQKTFPFDPTAPSYTGRKGRTIYVSKLGDNSDGSTWQKAFRTIQAGLSAVPDDRGGHTVVIRPDTYSEACLAPGRAGAAGAYNVIVGDADGRLGSGAKGWVVIDLGDPQLGFKSCDCWCLPGGAPTGVGVSTKRVIEPLYRQILTDKNLTDRQRKGAEEELAKFQKYPSTDPLPATLDRWIWRNLYAVAGNCMFWADQWNKWEGPDRHGTPFSTVVENCVGIGQAVGGGAASFIGRRGEPVLYRGCYFMNLDWPGDAGAAYVRAHDPSMPDYPDAVYEDCTLVSPDNALQTFSPGCDTGYNTRVKLRDCRLIVLNFSQPGSRTVDRTGWNAVSSSTGIIRCEALDAKQLHLDFENSLLMGYGLFGTRKGEPSYTITGKLQAYVQFQQPTPKGFERLGLWPAEVLQWLVPPESPNP
jgi:hypothetical protein